MLDLDTRKPLYVILLSHTKAASADLDLSSQAKQIILPGHFRRRAKYNTRNFFDKSRSQLRKKYGSTSSSLSARQIAKESNIWGERVCMLIAIIGAALHGFYFPGTVRVASGDVD